MFSWNKTETETSGPQTSERPDWLQNDTETASGKDWDTSEQVVTTELSLDNSPTSSGSTKEEKSGQGSFSSWCKRLIIVGVSTVLMALFIYSAVVQNNDKDKIEWYIFYSISAAIPACFLCHYMLCFPAKIIYCCSTGMAVWSIVNIVLISLKVADTPKGGEGNREGQTLREEYIWELSGVAVGLFSALYHACTSRFFVSTDNGKGEE
jgi:hypothetical protein